MTDKMRNRKEKSKNKNKDLKKEKMSNMMDQKTKM